jgi:hypothetical protein
LPRATIALGCWLLAACGPADEASARKSAIVEILEAHLRHEDALLDILERHGRDPATAEAHVRTYVAEHGPAMRELGQKRRLLEGDPMALAGAMRELEREMSGIFRRRRYLDEHFPELMTRDEVRTALGSLDAL